MTQEEIIKGNKLIAEFMGWTTHPKYGNGYVINKDKNRVLPPNYVNINTEGRLDDFNYNASWDWLMPVVEKIEGLVIKTNITSNIITIRVSEDDSFDIVVPFKKNNQTKLQGVYLAVVKFIEFYNTQTPNQ